MITLQECVEKQVAKAPKVERGEYVKSYRCPRCFSTLLGRVGKMDIGHETEYCCNCGQHLDWSDRNV